MKLEITIKLMNDNLSMFYIAKLHRNENAFCHLIDEKFNHL